MFLTSGPFLKAKNKRVGWLSSWAMTAVRQVRVLPAGCPFCFYCLGQQAILCSRFCSRFCFYCLVGHCGPPTKKFYSVPQGVKSRWGCWDRPPTGKQTALVAASGTATAASVNPLPKTSSAQETSSKRKGLRNREDKLDPPPLTPILALW